MSATLPTISVRDLNLDRALSKERIPPLLTKLQFVKLPLVLVSFAFTLALAGGCGRTWSSSQRKDFEPPTNGAPDDRDDAVSRWVRA
ncbi:MAG: hypothetical protein SWY16_05665 [Cyanobacteriota bacterium]|nr:hypothetical protein [Cyanobacteriota bacterium]